MTPPIFAILFGKSPIFSFHSVSFKVLTVVHSTRIAFNSQGLKFIQKAAFRCDSDEIEEWE